MRNKILFFCFVMVCIMLSDSYADEDILIVTEDWAPYSYLANGALIGFSSEIVQKILKVIDKSYEIRLLPGIRSKYLLDTRPSTIMFSIFRTPEREAIYKWVGPLCDGSIFFYKRRSSNLKIESLDDMKNVKRIACRQIGVVPNLLKKQGFKNLDSTATTSLQIYKKLLRGRCDLAISDTDLGVRHYLKLIGVKMDAIEKIPIKIFESDLYIACSKDVSDEEIQKWQSALEKLKTNGVYERVFQKYYLQLSR